MTPRHQQLLDKAERNLRALERDLAHDGDDPRLADEREATAQALEDLRGRRFTGPVMALVRASSR